MLLCVYIGAIKSLLINNGQTTKNKAIYTLRVAIKSQISTQHHQYLCPYRG